MRLAGNEGAEICLIQLFVFDFSFYNCIDIMRPEGQSLLTRSYIFALMVGYGCI